MNANKSKLMTAGIALAAGIVLIIFHNRIEFLSWISIIVGVTIMLPSAFLFMTVIRGKGLATPASSGISSIGGFCLGLLMCIFPSTFAGIFVYIFAALMIAVGILHVISVAKRHSKIRSLYLYIIPLLLIAAGITIVCTNLRSINSTVVLITGIALVASSVNSIAEYHCQCKYSADDMEHIDAI